MKILLLITMALHQNTRIYLCTIPFTSTVLSDHCLTFLTEVKNFRIVDVTLEGFLSSLYHPPDDPVAYTEDVEFLHRVRAVERQREIGISSLSRADEIRGVVRCPVAHVVLEAVVHVHLDAEPPAAITELLVLQILRGVPLHVDRAIPYQLGSECRHLGHKAYKPTLIKERPMSLKYKKNKKNKFL